MSKIMFCSEVELGGFVASIDVVPEAFHALPDPSSSSSSLSYKFDTSSSGIKILAFSCSNYYRNGFLNGGFDLVSSETFNLIGTKFITNKAAVELFQSLPLELKERKDELIGKPLIVTGLSLAGYVAILFTLWLQHAIDEKEASGSKDITKRPICITFGCPLVGNEPLQKAISGRPQWKSSFLNVIAKTDPVASFFSSNSPYMPFGTTLFCTESGGHTVFEDQESVLAVLDAMSSSRTANTEIPDYGNHLKSIRRKVLYRGVSQSGEFNQNPLRVGIEWQFKQLEVPDSNNLIEKIEEKQKVANKKKNVYEPSKKLNDMKISLTFMEWHMKTQRSKGGYYDYHRKKVQGADEIKRHGEIVRHQRGLKKYWEKMVEEKDLMPQKEGAKMRKRWLYGGTNYRRIVEPLEIADYYKNGGKDYFANRSNHFKLLEDWSNEDNKGQDPVGGRKKAASLTEDSCFWAHVEEALILLEELEKEGSGGISEDVRNKELEQFEAYLISSIKNYSLSPDVFLEGSSFMKWWNKYKEYKGSSYVSEFVRYMNEKSYKLYE